MIHSTGCNTVRDLIKDAIGNVQIGTGTTAESSADTALEDLAAEKAAAVFDGTTGEVRARGRLTASENNGESLTEAGVTISSVNATRQVHAAIAKTALIEVEYELSLTVVDA
jgi:hypothetical protein